MPTSIHHAARTLFFAAWMTAGSALGSLPAHALSVQSEQCTVKSDFGLRMQDDRIELVREQPAPTSVRFEAGRLWLDGVEQTLSRDDQRRVRAMQAQIEKMVPEVRGIAADAAAITVQALVHVANVLGNSDPEQARQRAERIEHGFLSKLDAQLAGDGWSEAGMEAELEQLATDLATDFASEVAMLAVSAALRGDTKTAEEIEARASKLEQVLEDQVEARAKVLEARAAGLCTLLEGFAKLDAELDLRDAAGQPLDLIRR